MVVEVELQSGDPFQQVFYSQFNVLNQTFSRDFQVNQVGQVTEDEEEQEPDSGEEETQVRKRKSSILRSIIHLFRCERFPVSLYLIERRSREN